MKIDYQTLLLAVEFGSKCHEKGHNLEYCLQEFRRLYPPPDPNAIPFWRTLDEEDQETLATVAMEEVRDSAKEIGHDMLDEYSIPEVLTCLDPDQDETRARLEYYLNNSVLVLGTDEVAEFIKKYQLCDDHQITKRGKQYLEYLS